MTEITLFRFENSELNAVMRSGEPWFFADDACAILDIKNSRDAISKLDDDEKGVVLTDTLGGQQNKAIISESGLYTLTLRCRDAMKPGTKPHRFRKWITSDVIPSIRKTGIYSVQTPSTDFAIPQTRAEALRLAADLEEENLALKAEKAETAPKLAVYDKCMNLDALFGLQQGGRMLRQKPNLFIQYLKTKWLFYQGGELIPRAQYSMAGTQTFDVKWSVIGEKSRAQTYLTQKGLDYFAKHLGVEIDFSQSIPPAKPASVRSREMELH